VPPQRAVEDFEIVADLLDDLSVFISSGLHKGCHDKKIATFAGADPASRAKWENGWMSIYETREQRDDRDPSLELGCHF
jgi:hypothetical protein